MFITSDSNFGRRSDRLRTTLLASAVTVPFALVANISQAEDLTFVWRVERAEQVQKCAFA